MSLAVSLQHKLRGKGQENTYLSGLGGDSPLWPSKDQIAKMAPAFDELMKAVGTNTFGSMKRRTDSREQRIQRLIHEASQAAAADHRADAMKRKCVKALMDSAFQARLDALRARCL